MVYGLKFREPHKTLNMYFDRWINFKAENNDILQYIAVVGGI